MDARKLRVIKIQYGRVTKKADTYLKFYMREDDVTTWYVIMSGFSGNAGEYVDGEYLVRIELPEDYPHKPPSFYFMTPQGLYGVETKVCVDIGEYHKDNYRAVLGVDGFCNQLISGLVAWRDMTPGIQILSTTEEQKRAFARDSVEYNRRHNDKLTGLVYESYVAYSSHF